MPCSGFAQFAQSGGVRVHARHDPVRAERHPGGAAARPSGFGTGLLAIFSGAGGPATDMATAISNIAYLRHVGAGHRGVRAALTTFLEQANVVLGDLLGIVGNVGSILISVFGAGAGGGGASCRSCGTRRGGSLRSCRRPRRRPGCSSSSAWCLRPGTPSLGSAP